MEIRPVDLADDDLMTRAHALTVRATLLGREDAPIWSLADFLGAMRSPDSAERFTMLAAHEAGELVGVGFLWVPLLDNLEKAYLEVQVDPAHARNGAGAALLRAVEDAARAESRSVLVADAKVPAGAASDHGYRRFAEREGYELVNVEVVRHARLPVPENTLADWSRTAALKHGTDYSLRTLRNELPAELAASLGELMGQLVVDAPTGDLDFEAEVVTPVQLAERLASVRAMGRDLYETVALTPDGTVAAQTTLAVPTDGATTAWQWGTFVHRGHRGRSLGLAVKAANLRAVQADHPAIVRVTTQNAETNEQMIAINELMGFRAVELSQEYAKRL